MTTTERLGEVLARLYAVIENRKTSAAEDSYTAQLLSEGAARCAKKFGEEAVEAAIAGATGDRAALASEAADTLYHLLVLMACLEVEPGDVAEILSAREGVSGITEKASR